jgi:hypothetical protein
MQRCRIEYVQALLTRTQIDDYHPAVALRILQNRGGLALSTGLGQGGSLGIGSAGLPRKCQTMKNSLTKSAAMRLESEGEAASVASPGSVPQPTPFVSLAMERLVSVRCMPVHPDNRHAAPYQIGKWIVHAPSLAGFFSREAQLCVVDNFGNLVGVRS